MKNKVLIIAALPFLLVSFCLNGQNAEKTLVRAFNLKGNNHVIFDVDGQIDVQKWNQDEMRVMMTINLPSGSDIMLKNLVKVGRYNLSSEEAADGLKVFAPGLEREVKLRSGEELKENISMIVYAPENVQVSSANGELAGLAEENE